MIKWLALLLLCSCASSSDRGAKSAVYQVGGGVTFGAATLPQTAKRLGGYYFHYGETNGILGKLITIILAAPQGKVSNVKHNSWCDGYYCYTETSYTYTPPSAEELAAYAAFTQGVMAGGLPMELNMDFFRGDDIKGYNFELLYRYGWRGFAGLEWAEIAGGFSMRRQRYPEIEALYVGGLNPAQMNVTEGSFSHTGIPIRFMVMPTKKSAIYTQFDWNFEGMFEDDDIYNQKSSLLRVGVRYWLPYVYLKAETALRGADFEDATFTLEAGIEI